MGEQRHAVQQKPGSEGQAREQQGRRKTDSGGCWHGHSQGEGLSAGVELSGISLVLSNSECGGEGSAMQRLHTDDPLVSSLNVTTLVTVSLGPSTLTLDVFQLVVKP